MANIGSFTRYCLNLQGYTQLTDEEKAGIDMAQRFKPSVCALLALVGLVLKSPIYLILPIVLGYWGAFFPSHPVDLLYDRVVRPVFHTPPLSPDPVPRRFACGMAATLLLLGALSWQLGADALGYIFVGMVVLASITVVLSGFCVGSFTYWLLARVGVVKSA